MISTNYEPLRIFLTFLRDQHVEYHLQSSQWSKNIHTISIGTFLDDSASHDVAIKVRLHDVMHGPT